MGAAYYRKASNTTQRTSSGMKWSYRTTSSQQRSTVDAFIRPRVVRSDTAT